MPCLSAEPDVDIETFRNYARDRRVIPVSRTLLADGVTAVGLYDAMCGNRAGTFLLESAEQGRTWSRYSFIGVRSAAMLTVRDGSAHWVGRVPDGIPTTGSPTDVLRATVEVLRTEPLPDLPPLTGGMVGYLSYDMVRAWERVPDTNPDELHVPDMAFLLATDLAVLDHAHGTVTLIANAINFDNSDARVDHAWADAVARLDAMQALLAAPYARQAHTYDTSATPVVTNRSTPEEYRAQVERAKEYIRAGDAFQIVVSQRFSTPCVGDALDVYRILRTSNPSPYMYLLRLPSTDAAVEQGALGEDVAFEIVGSSPEALVTVTNGRCTVHPIAGTRPRGGNPAQDIALGDELFADVKERAEHVMLVDLARNDLGRVCAPGSVDVVQFMSVERYSHVMHLVSTVVGDLAAGRTAFDALAATFPAGTLSGAPKPRAMAIIDELEPVRRGVYGGCIGYLDFAGNVDAAITIRTALIIEGIAYVQAGAGIVADSDPTAEDAECGNKAAAVLRAVAVGATLQAVT
jgi:anthranilate synthase component I